MRPGELGRVVGQVVIGRFFVDENLRRQLQAILILEQAGRQKMFVGGQQAVEQVRAAMAAKGTLGPGRRGIAGNGTGQLLLGAAMQRKGGALTSASAHAAMAYMDILYGRCGHMDCTAKALGLHVNSLGRH